MACTYARSDVADKIPLKSWRCARKNCNAPVVKRVSSPNGAGKIALCNKHLEEHRHGHSERQTPSAFGSALKESWE